MRLSILLLLFILLSSCDSPSLNSIDYSSEINDLTTPLLQREYLEEIFRLDQKCRTNLTEAEMQFGADSPESKAALEIGMEVDHSNIAKIESYIAKYGHPSKLLHGENAASTPSLVIHHSPGTQHRQWFFPYLYRAYRLGDIDDGGFTFYMNRWYRIANGERLKLQSPFRIETEVDTLIKAMSMHEFRLEIDKELQELGLLR